MKHVLLAALIMITVIAPARAEDAYLEELTCLPVNGYIQIPGIKFDDLSPFARETFNSNPAAVTNALYALPYEEREDFITLYLEPAARERHRYFFTRCKEISERRAQNSLVDNGKEIIPGALRNELLERERVRLALHEGAIPFRLGGRIVHIPIPFGYSVQDSPVPGFVDNPMFENNLAVFRKDDVPRIGEEPLVKRSIIATVKHVREGADNLGSMLQAYRIMVDAGWRITGMYPPDSTPGTAETVEYKWNLKPFNIRDNSFCYGQFEKTIDFHGVEQIRYRTTAVIVLPASYIQVSVNHTANTGLDTVNEMNTDLTRWRDAILTANYE